MENNGKGLSHELGSRVEGLSCDRGSQRLAFADVTPWLMPKGRQGGPRTAFNWHGQGAGKCPCLGWNNFDYIFASFACLSTPRQLGISTSQAAQIRGAPVRMREAGNVISEENPFNFFLFSIRSRPMVTYPGRQVLRITHEKKKKDKPATGNSA